MTVTVKRVEYFYSLVRDQPGEAFDLLSALEESGINLHAFSAIPMGEERCQLVLFPEDPPQLQRAAEHAGMSLEGPRRAFLVQGDDHLGALVEVHRTLVDAGVNLSASSGVAAACGGFGYIFYVGSGQYETAAEALGI